MQLVENSVSPLLAHDEKTLSGLFAEMGTINQNGRRYPEDVYEQAYTELIPKIREKRLLGELDHPLDYDEVRLTNVSHAITSCELLEKNGIKQVWGTVELLDTPAGMIAQSLVKAGIPLGISSRGLGSTKQMRDAVDVTQFKLITYDLVAEPSFSNAILTPDKSRELSDSLHYIESKLPLNESVESQSVRSLIESIRESFLCEKNESPEKEINVESVELDSLKNLLESTRETIKSDTQIMRESRKQIKDLQSALDESDSKYKALLQNMFKLQESYNQIQDAAQTSEQEREELIELRKMLAVEKRGMSYERVSELLEGAITSEEIESRLNSLSSMSKKRQTSLTISKDVLTESTSVKETKLRGLASIVSKV